MKKPTMRDIAKAVGTSAVTVSKAMAGKPGMSDKLRMKILKKAAEMGYEYPGSDRVVIRQHLDIGQDQAGHRGHAVVLRSLEIAGIPGGKQAD